MKRYLSIVLVVIGAMASMSLYGANPPKEKTEPQAGVPAGSLAPNFKLVDIRTGKSVQLSDFKGKAVLVNFWAPWCGACKHEIPWFISLQKIHAAEGLQVIGIAVDDSGDGQVAKFVDDLNMNYPVLRVRIRSPTSMEA